MNTREVMQALLDGKTLIERIPRICDNYIRLRGDDLEHMGAQGEWRENDLILINPKYTSVKEEEE